MGTIQSPRKKGQSVQTGLRFGRPRQRSAGVGLHRPAQTTFHRLGHLRRRRNHTSAHATRTRKTTETTGTSSDGEQKRQRPTAWVEKQKDKLKHFLPQPVTTTSAEANFSFRKIKQRVGGGSVSICLFVFRPPM